MFLEFMTRSNQNLHSIVIAGLTRNPWMPDQVRHDSVCLGPRRDLWTSQ